MALVFNADDLMKNLTAFIRSSDTEMDESVYALFHVKVEELCKTCALNHNLKLQEYSIRVQVFRPIGELYDVRVNVRFPDNLKYKVSLSYINSQSKLIFVDSLQTTDVTRESLFYFSKPIRVFKSLSSSSFVLWDENLVNGYLYLFLKFMKKDTVIPFNMRNPKWKMSNQFALLYENQVLTDFKIVCQDQEFLCHKVILAARSPVFQAMFEHDLKEAQDNKVQIIDFEPGVIQQMLKYIYTDNVDDLGNQNVEKILQIADKYCLENLKMMCMKEISKSVTEAAELLKVISTAEKYNVSGLQEFMNQFLEDDNSTI